MNYEKIMGESLDMLNASANIPDLTTAKTPNEPMEPNFHYDNTTNATDQPSMWKPPVFDIPDTGFGQNQNATPTPLLPPPTFGESEVNVYMTEENKSIPGLVPVMVFDRNTYKLGMSIIVKVDENLFIGHIVNIMNNILMIATTMDNGQPHIIPVTVENVVNGRIDIKIIDVDMIYKMMESATVTKSETVRPSIESVQHTLAKPVGILGEIASNPSGVIKPQSPLKIDAIGDSDIKRLASEYADAIVKKK